ncbi:hypothetical protein C1H46_020024 [Malus baccata]|uniref:F-box domain-containing protein n=1 Tax=Malus baccata TaxID=106549 RepID=A0A540M6M5_MALBA|nr:hypothetical protein C1H46_020024 [Malus baccata]
MMKEENPNLPWEMIREIFSWLPVKSLGQFRCVSKPCRSFISDPNFAKIQLSRTIDNKHILFQRRRLVFTNEKRHSIYFCNLDELLNQDSRFLDDGESISENIGKSVVVSNLDYVHPEQSSPDGSPLPNFWVLISYCNGLVLFKLNGQELYLVNPAIREYKKLPKPPSFNALSLSGFGFDHASDDYKVVNGWSVKDEIEFAVYSLKTGFWRVIERRFPYKAMFCFIGFMLNGGVHWLVKIAQDDSWVIISFLLAEEEVREIPVPFTSYKPLHYKLGVFGEFLCIADWVSSHVDEQYTDFWVMKEYGVRESWTEKKFSSFIPFSLVHSGCWKKDYVLLICQHKKLLVMYDFSDGSSHCINIYDFPKVSDAGFYVESLVSLN